MIYSRISLAVALLAALSHLTAAAKEDPVELLKRHRYLEAVAVWDKEGGGKADEQALRSTKGKALAYFRLGSLYENLDKFSLAVMEQYYGTQIKGGGSSPLYPLYQGQILYRQGKYARAKASFEAVAKKKKVSPAVLEMAKVFLEASVKRLAGSETAGEAKTAKDNAAQWQALELAGAEPPPGLQATSQRARRSKLRLLTRPAVPSQGEIEKALKAVVDESDQPEAYLDRDKNTQINFYDPFLLPTLSAAYYTLSKALNLRVREEEKKFPDLAAKFKTGRALSEVCLKLGQVKEAAGFLDNDADAEGQLLRVQLLVGQNKAVEADNLLETLSKSAKTPSLMKDIADCYYLLGRNPEAGLKLAARALKEKDGSNYHRTYASLLFSVGKNDAALQEYAKGYKIEYRNRIDQIDPEYMSDYAFAIFRTNKLRYEEVVETLYYLQKEFPPCRQMHYCMQGISASLARSFESQRIFRKGG